MNTAFQTIKQQWSIANSNAEKTDLVLQMRKNLISRNEGGTQYTKQYIEPGKVIDISNCSVSDLFAVDGDMNPQNL